MNHFQRHLSFKDNKKIYNENITADLSFHFDILRWFFLNFFRLDYIFSYKFIVDWFQMSESTKMAKQQANPVASKKIYETYWKAIYWVIIAISSIVMTKVYQYQTLPLFENSRKGSLLELLWMGLPVMVVFTILDHAVHYFDDWFLLNYINQSKYPDMERRRKRCYTFTKWVFSEFYYLPCSIWAYVILQPTTFMPTWLGGNGNPHAMSSYLLSFDEVTDQMRYFYILQFSKHLSRFFSHVFIRSEGNFYEYALHHGLSTFLILFSYLTNMWFVGIMVLLFHDITDFQLILCRMYRDYKYRNEKVLKILDYSLAPTWLCGRIFFFTYGCILSGIAVVRDLMNPEIFTAEQASALVLPLAFMTFMMICLQGLQLFWTYYIFSSFLSVNFTSKIRHTYD